MSRSETPSPPGPTKAVIAYAEGVAKKDAIELAKGYALKHFASPNTARYAVLPFMSGWLYEVHEANAKGRKGKAHLSSIVARLGEGKETAWFRVDGRVFSVSIKDARPYGVLLPAQASASMVKTRPELEVLPTDSMADVVNRGETFMAVGMTVFVIGSATLGGALAYDIATKINVPQMASFQITDAPHRQWERVSQTPRGLYVDALRYDGSLPVGQQWTLSRKPVARGEDPVPSPVTQPEPAAVAVSPAETTPPLPAPTPEGIDQNLPMEPLQ